MITQKRIDVNYKPIWLESSFTTEGTVPGMQTYNLDTGEEAYSPDYSMSPLVLQLRVSVIDPDGIIPGGYRNADLANVTFQVWDPVNEEYRTITTSNSGGHTDASDYSMTLTGANAGRIVVKNNVATTDSPVTLRVSAQYINPKNSQVHLIQGQYTIRVMNATSTAPALELDIYQSLAWDPLVDDDSLLQARALIRIAGEEQAYNADKMLFIWTKYDEARQTWVEIGNDPLDYDAAATGLCGQTLLIDRSLMGDVGNYKVFGLFSPIGEVSSMTVSSNTPSATLVVKRRIDSYEVEIINLPEMVPQDTCALGPSVDMKMSDLVVDDFEKEFDVLWYVSPNTYPVSYTLAAVGRSPILSAELLSPTSGMLIGVDVIDRGADKAWTDSDNAILTDSDGKLLIIK